MLVERRVAAAEGDQPAVGGVDPVAVLLVDLLMLGMQVPGLGAQPDLAAAVRVDAPDLVSARSG
jgi:hypothetical protein